MRCWQATESLWLDELHTSWVVAEGMDVIVSRSHAGNQSPLFFFIVWGVVQLCGHTAWALRLTSLVSGILLIAAAAWLVWRWTGSVSSCLLSALLLAMNRDCIFFAQEARPYALLQLSALCHAVIFAAMLKRPTVPNRAVFVLGAVWLFYLHYTAFLFLLAEAICLTAIRGLRVERIAYSWSQAARDACVILLLFLPAGAHLVDIAHHKDNWARIVQAWPLPLPLQYILLLFGLVPAVAVYLAGPAEAPARPGTSEINRRNGRYQDGRWTGALLSRAGAILHHSRRRARGLRPLGSLPAIWAACWFLVPILLAWLSTVSQIAALCMMRYVIASVAGAIVFAALSHHVIERRWARGTLAGVLIAGTILSSGIVPQLYRDGRVIGDRNEAWDRAASWIEEQVRRGASPVFVCAGLLEDRALRGQNNAALIEYCLFPLSGIYRLRTPHLEPLPTTPRVTLSTSQKELVRRCGSMWLLVRAGPRMTRGVTRALCRDLHSAGLPVIVLRRREFGSLTVLKLGLE